MKTMLALVFGIFYVLCGVFTPSLAYGEGNKTLSDISDTLCIATPVIAVGSSLMREEPVDTGIFLLQVVSQELFVEGMKSAFSDTSIGRRPSDKEEEGKSKGMISSHVSVTTAGAIKLWRLYPGNYWVKGASALSVGVVAYQRVEGDHHTVFQAGLGIATAFLFDFLGNTITDYFQKEDSFLPFMTGNKDKVMFQLNLPESGNGIGGMMTWRF